MGYRVGGQCFRTEQEASDYKMSMVAPAITADGQIKMPVRKADGWYYTTTTTITKPRPYPYTGNYVEKISQEQKIILTHPQCDQTEMFREGLSVGMMLLPFFMVAFFVRLVIGVIRKANTPEGKDD